MNRTFTYFIVGAMVLGVAVGFACNQLLGPDQIKRVTEGLSILTDIFLRLFKMIIAPLIFATLVSGIVHMGDTASLGRVGAKTIGWFLGATIVSLTLGMILVNILQPGAGEALFDEKIQRRVQQLTRARFLAPPSLGVGFFGWYGAGWHERIKLMTDWLVM